MYLQVVSLYNVIFFYVFDSVTAAPPSTPLNFAHYTPLHSHSLIRCTLIYLPFRVIYYNNFAATTEYRYQKRASVANVTEKECYTNLS